ncbi:hypothetical protein [Hyphomonas sp.]|uniref:hypothetical protein n=1 Tax=Hyphomonas sp. TaxID=87 RepID=UPI00391C520C
MIGAEGEDLIEALNGVIEGYAVDICYCSILGQCWVLSDDTSTEIGQCPNHGADEFLN